MAARVGGSEQSLRLSCASCPRGLCLGSPWLGCPPPHPQQTSEIFQRTWREFLGFSSVGLITTPRPPLDVL